MMTGCSSAALERTLGSTGLEIRTYTCAKSFLERSSTPSSPDA